MKYLNASNYQLVKQDGSREVPLPGYPVYPPNEDIYNQDKEEADTDPEQLSKIKGGITFDELEVPGSELDDSQEAIGSEDEENNYYSVGGDDHDRLEEDTDNFGAHQ